MTLLDSNIFILGSRPDADASFPALFRKSYAYSIVSRIEVLGFSRFAAEERSRLQDLLRGGSELQLTKEIADRAVELRQLRRMSLGDAIIAATALVHSLPLVTRNIADFRPISDLVLLPA